MKGIKGPINLFPPYFFNMAWQNLLDEAAATPVLEGCLDSVLDSNGVSPWMIELASVRSDIRRACELQASNVLQKKGSLQYPMSGTLYFAFRISHFAYRISHIAYRISHIAYRISHIAYRISHFAY